MKNLLRFIMKNAKFKYFVKKIYNEYLREFNVVNQDVPEILDLNIRPSNLSGVRINLVIPALSENYVFGGIATALKFFEELGRDFDNLRIILTDESNFSHNSNRKFKEWRILSLSDNDLHGRLIVPAGNRWGGSIPVSKGDIFITTAWWTEFIVSKIIEKQKKEFNLFDLNPHIYFIQDYEPGFYAWSSRYALAESTYHLKENSIVIFNTKILYDFFISKNYKFSNAFFFDPSINRNLINKLKESASTLRARKIIVYGRPSVARNAFEIIVMGLKMWCKQNSYAKSWEFISAGEKHEDLDLGNGACLKSLGKLSINEYGDLLASSYAGISLMISPHPSYPPLEMGAFGLQVITNKYGIKDLSLLSSNLISIDKLSPEEICLAIDKVIKNYEKNPISHNINSEWLDSYKEERNQFKEPINFIKFKISGSINNIF